MATQPMSLDPESPDFRQALMRYTSVALVYAPSIDSICQSGYIPCPPSPSTPPAACPLHSVHTIHPSHKAHHSEDANWFLLLNKPCSAEDDAIVVEWGVPRVISSLWLPSIYLQSNSPQDIAHVFLVGPSYDPSPKPQNLPQFCVGVFEAVVRIPSLRKLAFRDATLEQIAILKKANFPLAELAMYDFCIPFTRKRGRAFLSVIECFRQSLTVLSVQVVPALNLDLRAGYIVLTDVSIIGNFSASVSRLVIEKLYHLAHLEFTVWINFSGPPGKHPDPRNVEANNVEEIASMIESERQADFRRIPRTSIQHLTIRHLYHPNDCPYNRDFRDFCSGFRTLLSRCMSVSLVTMNFSLEFPAGAVSYVPRHLTIGPSLRELIRRLDISGNGALRNGPRDVIGTRHTQTSDIIRILDKFWPVPNSLIRSVRIPLIVPEKSDFCDIIAQLPQMFESFPALRRLYLGRDFLHYLTDDDFSNGHFGISSHVTDIHILASTPLAELRSSADVKAHVKLLGSLRILLTEAWKNFPLLNSIFLEPVLMTNICFTDLSQNSRAALLAVWYHACYLVLKSIRHFRHLFPTAAISSIYDEVHYTIVLVQYYQSL